MKLPPGGPFVRGGKGLSDIYMIVNKITKDYYIGATNRFYARFSNHLIRGSKNS